MRGLPITADDAASRRSRSRPSLQACSTRVLEHGRCRRRQASRCPLLPAPRKGILNLKLFERIYAPLTARFVRRLAARRPALQCIRRAGSRGLAALCKAPPVRHESGGRVRDLDGGATPRRGARYPRLAGVPLLRITSRSIRTTVPCAAAPTRPGPAAAASARYRASGRTCSRRARRCRSGETRRCGAARSMVAAPNRR